MGISYQTLSPLIQLDTDYGGEFQITDISAILRVPLPNFPTIQPSFHFGVASYTAIDRLYLER